MVKSNLVGKQFGNYRLARLLGREGSTDVYLGKHVLLREPVAVKILYESKENIKDIVTEVQLLFKLNHPHIERILDFGVQEDKPYLICEYASEGSLSQCYPRGTRVPSKKVVKYIDQIAQALQYMHDRHMIHRDIKPENILLRSHDEILLTDFGIVSLVHSESPRGLQKFVGTPAYMAPEQFSGKANSASDQYSLGVIAYELLTGERPFQGDFIQLMYQHSHDVSPRLREKIPTISSGVEKVIMKALAKEPAARYPNVLSFAEALELALNQESRSIDAYISYSSRDSKQVEDIVKKLEKEGNLRVWLDRWRIVPGQSMAQTKKLGLDQAESMVIFVGASTSSSWLQGEIEHALARQSRDPSFSVIPVLLPSAKDVEIDQFLGLRTCIDFRSSDVEFEFHRLLSGIKGVLPGRSQVLSGEISEKSADVIGAMGRLISRDLWLNLASKSLDNTESRTLQQQQIDEETKLLSLSAIAHPPNLEDDNKAFAGKLYNLQAGVAISIPDEFHGEVFDVAVRNPNAPIPFDIVLHASEDIEITSDWQHHLLYHPDSPELALVEFTFKALKTGPCLLAVNFYHERQWLRAIRFTFDAVEQTQSILVSSED